VTAAQRPAPGAPAGPGAEQAGRWREAALLRRDHPGWVIVWLAPAGEFRAYRRLPGTRRDTVLAAATAAGLAAQISQAERGRRRPAARQPGSPS
jgi:hypothetical protein